MEDVKANLVEGFDYICNPGDYYFAEDNKALIAMCPSGCGELMSLPLTILDNNPRWEWNGDKECPSLTPSIQRRGPNCTWHGYLTNGVWKSV